MPKTTNKRKKYRRRNNQAPGKVAAGGTQKQATPEYNDSDLADVIPPRLLKKLRRIPRLAELERMFDEPTSSSEDYNLPTTASSLNNTESTDLPTPALPSSSNIDCDNMPSTSSGRTARPSEPPPPSTDTDPDSGNNATQVVDTTTDNYDKETVVALSSDDDENIVSPMVDKATNTLETYKNKSDVIVIICGV